MIRKTFVHIAGLGAQTERQLWESGCDDWSVFLDQLETLSIGTASKEVARREIRRSMKALETGEHQYFARKLKQKNAWRAFPAFRHSCAYLDIETDGRATGDAVTMIGLYDGSGFQCFVQGENLESFRDAISNYSMIITFFGTGFDLPMIQKRFPDILLDQIHVDLYPLFRTIGVKGGLKKIEEQFGIVRSPDTIGLTGFDAVKLWRDHMRGRPGALDRLIAYNREDVVNLEPLALAAYERVMDATLKGESLDPHQSKPARSWRSSRPVRGR